MKQYIRTFSIRELLSAFFSSLMLVSLLFLFNQMNMFDHYFFVAFFTLTLPIALGHRFYFLEHRRRNRLMGRIMQNLITSVNLIILFASTLHLAGTFHEIGSFENLFFAIFAYMLVVELVLTILNKLFLFIGWRIW